MLRNELEKIYSTHKHYSRMQETSKEIAVECLSHISLNGFIEIDDGESGCIEYANSEIVNDDNIDDLINFLKENPEITHLSLSSQHFKDLISFTKLNRVSTIKKLDITETLLIKKELIGELAKNQYITHLSLERCQLSDEMIQAFINENPKMTHLNLQRCNLTYEAFQMLVDKTALQEIDARDNMSVVAQCGARALFKRSICYANTKETFFNNSAESRENGTETNEVLNLNIEIKRK